MKPPLHPGAIVRVRLRSGVAYARVLRVRPLVVDVAGVATRAVSVHCDAGEPQELREGEGAPAEHREATAARTGGPGARAITKRGRARR